MALITDLPTTSAPATSDYMITDTGSATQKVTINNLFAAVKSRPIPAYVNLSGSPYNGSIGAYIKANCANNTITPIAFTNATDVGSITAGVCLAWRTNLTASTVALVWASGASNNGSVDMYRLTLPS